MARSPGKPRREPHFEETSRHKETIKGAISKEKGMVQRREGKAPS